MNCEEFKKNIDSYIDQELSKKESNAFEQHLKNCERCKLELMSYEKCKRLIQKFFKDKNPPPTIRKKVFEKCGCIDMKNIDCCASDK